MFWGVSVFLVLVHAEYSTLNYPLIVNSSPKIDWSVKMP